jgi:hypothetical protein
MSYPVVAEFYSIFESILMANAKRLVDDIAHKQGASSATNELWKKVKEKIKVGVMDIELPEPLPTYCSFPTGHSDGAIKTRCRAPCLLGYDACPTHIQKQIPVTDANSESVDRIFDCEGIPYFINEKGIAMDRNGKPKGTVREGILYLFQLNDKK